MRSPAHALVLALLAGGARSQAPPPPAGIDLVAMAVARVEAIASIAPGPEQDDAVATAILALEMAGPSALPALAARLDAATALGISDASAAAVAPASGQVFAWSIGVSGEPRAAEGSADDGAAAPAVASLRRALWASDWPTRMSSASSLGLLEARDSGPDLVALLHAAGRAGQPEGPILLALAGVGGDAADGVIEEALLEGGDLAWGRSMLALHARRGATSWRALVRAVAESADPAVRMTAAGSLLLLAEPASACAVGEIVGREAEPAIRMTLVQALASTSSPQAHAILSALALHDVDEQVREAAAILAVQRLDDRVAGRIRVASARVREALDGIARGRAFPRDLRDVEEGATLVDLPVIERTLRRLPLREDGAWLDDHARLAQVRARILCAAWPDGIPQGRPRVGRL